MSDLDELSLGQPLPVQVEAPAQLAIEDGIALTPSSRLLAPQACQNFVLTQIGQTDRSVEAANYITEEPANHCTTDVDAVDSSSDLKDILTPASTPSIHGGRDGGYTPPIAT